MNATFTGVHEYDAQLPNWSSAQEALEQAELEALRANLESRLLVASDDYAELRDNAVALDTHLALANIRLRLLELQSEHFRRRNPALWTGEAIFGVVSLMIRDFAQPAERLPAITARLAAMPEFLNTMRERIVLPVPERWRDRAVRECNAAIELVVVGVNLWLAEHIPDSWRDVRIVPLRAAARKAFEAIVEVGTWVGQIAVADAGAYAAGEELFSEILKHGHFCHEAPRTLLQRAEAALQYERARLGQLLSGGDALTALTGDSSASDNPLQNWPRAQAEIAADHPPAKDYYQSFASRWQAIHDAVVAHDAVSWPQWPIRYVPMPGWAQTAAPQLYWLFYRSPAPFDVYSTYEYVVTPIDRTMSMGELIKRLPVWNHSAITLNHVVHHGGVGHHVQNWNATHRSSSRVGTIAAVDCASRIGMFLGGSMAEGWACYATELVEELGLLTPLEIVSQQHTRVRQLARAVVDIRLHTNDWSFDECAQFYVQQTGMSVDLANAETTKNSMFPGTAVMYWLGTQGILDLREQIQTALGEQFNLRAFHDELLSRGSIPVPLVSKVMLSKFDHA